jgi:N6-L-threonylcarbamoyladenine synthase
MIILGIETSCDETSAALIEKTADNTLHVLANTLSSSLSLHAQTGGIIPEVAAREQVKYMLPVLEDVCQKAFGCSLHEAESRIDAIAVTYGPGLIGSLLVGVETARTLAAVWDKPIIPINHMLGHIYANWFPSTRQPNATLPELPALALIVSGGHTDLLYLRNHGEYTLLGGTRDDAAGEAFDKIGRLLGMSYPAGPEIERRAKVAGDKRILLPTPLKYSDDFDFSFSGLKTAALREVQKQETLTEEFVNTMCASVLESIVDVLVYKVMKAAKDREVTSFVLGGGVAANQTLCDAFKSACEKEGITFYVPDRSMCTDNGAMIAAAAVYLGKPTTFDQVFVDPQLYFPE